MILALDFDGVICDSVAECLDTSYIAFRCSTEWSHLPDRPPKDWRDAFLERRGLVRPSGHFYLLWRWIVGFPNHEMSAEEFEKAAEDNADVVEAFEEAFHRLRAAGQAADPAVFVAANPVFPGVCESWGDLVSPRYIVTAKDEVSVRLILEANQLAVDGVFGRGSGPKAATLCALAARHGVAPREVVFIDDNALHVADAEDVGVTAVLAEWGYGPRLPAPRASLAKFADLLTFLA